MLSLAAMLPVWILSLSIFHFTVVHYRFQTGFDLITPSVIQQFLTYAFDDEVISLRMDPLVMTPGIYQFVAQQFSSYDHPYALIFQYYHADQIQHCFQNCMGVKITLHYQLSFQDLASHRHYQLQHHE
jgi:hypothetical protein